MNKKILLIDSEPLRTQELARPLAAAGFDVVFAGAGAEALANFDAADPGLVLIECEQDVLEVCKSLQAKDPGGNTPIIMHGHHPALGGLPTSLKAAGCKMYIETPVSDDQLVSVCRELLEIASAPVAFVSAPSVKFVGAVREQPAPLTDGILEAVDVDEAMGNLDGIMDIETARPLSAAKELAGDFTDILGGSETLVDEPTGHLALEFDDDDSFDLSVIDERLTPVEMPPTLEESRAASAARAEALEQDAALAEARETALAAARAQAEANARAQAEAMRLADAELPEASNLSADEDVYDLEIGVEGFTFDDDDTTIVPVDAIPEPIRPLARSAVQSNQQVQEFTFDLNDGSLAASVDGSELNLEPSWPDAEGSELEVQIASSFGADAAPTTVNEASESSELVGQMDHPDLVGLEDDDLAWSDDVPSMPESSDMSIPPFLADSEPEIVEIETDLAGARTNPGIAPTIPMVGRKNSPPRQRTERLPERPPRKRRTARASMPPTAARRRRAILFLGLAVTLGGAAAWLFVPGSPIHYTLWAGELDLPFIGRIWTPPSERSEVVPEAVPASISSGVRTVVPENSTEGESPAVPTQTPDDNSALDEPETGIDSNDDATASLTPHPGGPSTVEPLDATQANGPGFEPPSRRLRVVPDFTADDLAVHAEDRIVLRVLIGTGGAVESVLVLEGAAGSDSVGKAIDAVMSTKYRAATQNGEPVSSWIVELFELR